ncbi:type VI secretion system baseplate subunit TssK, partial [Xanthomonas euvesicatoria]|uniref:type VI secretion system baseplate subunit TssK n=1 Tax=Xanthomonas euvesicatoria TaxID=456327 RepID=UPI003CCF129D
MEQIRDLVNLQLPGRVATPMPVAPRQNPYHAGDMYYEFDKSAAMWRTVKHFDGIAFPLG